MSVPFTPGPWAVEPDRRTDGRGEYLAGWNIVSAERDVVGIEGIHADATDEANARLIAAAPELFAFTDAALDQLEVLHSTLPKGEARAAVWRVILAGRAALAKVVSQ